MEILVDYTGPAVLAVSKGLQSQFRYCLWHRSSYSTDFDMSEIASPVIATISCSRFYNQSVCR